MQEGQFVWGLREIKLKFLMDVPLVIAAALLSLFYFRSGGMTLTEIC